MKPILAIENFFSHVVVTWWTPFFLLVFLAIVAYALWPSNRRNFDEAAKMPLRED